jgi:hypothetical protein
MKRNYSYITAILLAVLFGLGTSLNAAGDGQGSIRLGYTFIDEEGNLGVNQETYNLYEGAALSLSNWNYFFDNGISVTAQLDNITLNNRNLRATIRKPGRFTVSGYHNQYRRTYDFNGGRFTRRRASGGQAVVQPHKYVKLFGGYSVTEKHGTNMEILSPVSDTVLFSSDYLHSRFNVGGQIDCRYGFLRAEYRQFTFDDRVRSASDRQAKEVSVTASTTIPKYDWILLSGGYRYRLDKMNNRTLELETNQGWGGTKVYLPRNFIFDYRILFARTRHTGNLLETDNVYNTAALGKNWPGYGGVRVGYENRIVDDLVDRTVSNGLFVSSWYNYRSRLFVNFRVSTRSKDVVTGATLTGNEEVTLHRLSVKYRDNDWGTVTALWEGRIRENEDIKSTVDYNILTGTLALQRKKCGRMNITYSYYVGVYDNRGDNVRFEFSDHLVTGMIYPNEYHNVTFEFGGTYYRSRRDVDVEKFSLRFGVSYAFLKDHRLEVRYNVYNYDDLVTRGLYYTANIVEVNIVKDLKL